MRPPHPDPLLLRVDVINGWPLSLTFPQETVIFPAAFVRTMVADFEAIFSMSCFLYGVDVKTLATSAACFL